MASTQVKDHLRYDPKRVDKQETGNCFQLKYHYDHEEGDSPPTVKIVPVPDQSTFEIIFEVKGQQRDVFHRSKPFPREIREEFYIKEQRPGKKHQCYKVTLQKKDSVDLAQYFKSDSPVSSQEDST